MAKRTGYISVFRNLKTGSIIGRQTFTIAEGLETARRSADHALRVLEDSRIAVRIYRNTETFKDVEWYMVKQGKTILSCARPRTEEQRRAPIWLRVGNILHGDVDD